MSSSVLNNFVGPTGPAGAGSSRGSIDGLILAPSSIIDQFNNIDISPGSCMNSSNIYTMTISALLTKKLDAAWAAGNFAGGLFSGSKTASTWYHVFLIRKTSDGSIDAGFDTSVIAANIPSGYSAYRRLGSIRTDATNLIQQFTQNGNWFIWKNAVGDVTAASPGTAAVVRTLTVPINIKVMAYLNSRSDIASTVYLSSLDAVDETPGATTPIGTFGSSAGIIIDGAFLVWTNTSAQIRSRTDAGGTTLRIATLGWIDLRGQNIGDAVTLEAYTWGLNTTGQIGDNTTTNRSSPVSVVGNHNFIKVAPGGIKFALGLKIDGTCWSWGLAGSQTGGIGGQLGDNQIAANRSSPVSVVGNHNFWQVSAQHQYRGGHAAGLKLLDGSAWTWGTNGYGGLGDNTVANRSSPISVVGAHSFNKICCGYYMMIALKVSNGSAWAWGRNITLGMLGDNTVTNRSSPVSVVGAHSFIDVATNKNNNIALKANGSAWCWGDNANGQLGQNDIVNRSSPASVIGAHSFAQTSAGEFGSFGLKSDGSIWAWGLNTSGQLGDGTSINRSSPVSVVGGHSFIRICGSATTFGLKADGSLWGWGSNGGGYIGDNATGNKTSPVSIVGAFSFRNIPFNNYRNFGGIIAI